jgi:translation initiation factor IF-2
MTTSSNKNKRPPVVVVMGHVDHGKTTLLDFIRKTNMAAREAGGITQAVGAYEITHNKERITFIDTPGHEAFSKMRSRGAQIADIAILVVAADDGVNVQTKEAIKIILESEIPYIVAISKIDISGANIEKAKSSLLQAGVLLEGMGGSTSFQAVSAKTGEGVAELLDLILLTAEVEELTCDLSAPAEGFILEAHMGNGGGTVTAIIKNGTLKTGDTIATPSTSGKVKGLKNFLGETSKELTPCSPAIILGFETLPSVGDPFATGDKIIDLPKAPVITQRDGGAAMIAGTTKMNLILKAGVAGGLEALSDAVKKLKVPGNTNLVIASEGVGEITDGDVKQAISTNGIIIGFKVKITPAAKTLLTAQRIKLFQSDIIYELLESVEEELSGKKRQMVAADLEILAVFDQKNKGAQIIGGKVTEGELKNQSEVEIHRKGTQVGTGKITNLQQSKKDVNEVVAGLECGMLFSSSILVVKGDHLIARPL